MTYPHAIRALFPAETRRLGYSFFRRAGERAFDFSRPDECRWQNAWWCSQLSLLAYHDDASAIAPALAAGGLQLAGEIVEAGGLRAFVAWKGDTAFVVFRGTVLPLPDFPFGLGPYESQIKSWLTNLDGHPVAPRHGGPGMVHKGFQNALKLLETHGLDSATLTAGKEHVVWTGHSLGGALATLAPRVIPPAATAKQTIVTFGSARAADAAFVTDLHVPHERFVNGEDLFAATPPNPLLALIAKAYTHHGATLPAPNGWSSPAVSDVLNLINDQISPGATTETGGGFIGGLLPGVLTDSAAVIITLIPAALRDHAPMLYTAMCERALLAGS
jgi:hypothetical protein